MPMLSKLMIACTVALTAAHSGHKTHALENQRVSVAQAQLDAEKKFDEYNAHKNQEILGLLMNGDHRAAVKALKDQLAYQESVLGKTKCNEKVHKMYSLKCKDANENSPAWFIEYCQELTDMKKAGIVCPQDVDRHPPPPSMPPSTPPGFPGLPPAPVASPSPPDFCDIHPDYKICKKAKFCERPENHNKAECKPYPIVVPPGESESGSGPPPPLPPHPPQVCAPPTGPTNVVGWEECGGACVYPAGGAYRRCAFSSEAGGPANKDECLMLAASVTGVMAVEMERVGTDHICHILLPWDTLCYEVGLGRKTVGYHSSGCRNCLEYRYSPVGFTAKHCAVLPPAPPPAPRNPSNDFTAGADWMCSWPPCQMAQKAALA